MRFKLEATEQGWLDHPFFLPRAYRRWLADQGSLTHRLKQHCMHFSVRLVRVGLLRPGRDESSLLQIRPDESSYVREVALLCEGQPVVFAHSVVAASSLRGPWAAVSGLGSRPLGEALFSNPMVARGSLQYRRISASHPLSRRARQAGVSIEEGDLWARRSLFRLQGHPLLVTEVFLPAILSLKPR